MRCFIPGILFSVKTFTDIIGIAQMVMSI